MCVFVKMSGAEDLVCRTANKNAKKHCIAPMKSIAHLMLKYHENPLMTLQHQKKAKLNYLFTSWKSKRWDLLLKHSSLFILLITACF